MWLYRIIHTHSFCLTLFYVMSSCADISLPSALWRTIEYYHQSSWVWGELNCVLSMWGFFVLCVSGQSVHLGMGGSWSCAVPRHFWTLCHILPGLLYLLLHWRVSSETFEDNLTSLSFTVNHNTSGAWLISFLLISKLHFCFAGALRSLCYMERLTRRNTWKSASTRTYHPHKLVYWR